MRHPPLPLTLHVGLPKTGSSALQQMIFANHPDLAYTALARKGGRHCEDSAFGRFVACLREGDLLGLDPCATRALLLDSLEADAERAPGATAAVLSEERFTGILGAGLGAKADLAAELLPEARVLLVLREPALLLVSHYYQLLRHPPSGLVPPRDIDSWLRQALDSRGHHLSHANLLDLDRLVERWERRFGQERVEILLFEDWVSRRRRFLERLSHILGVRSSSTTGLAERAATPVNRRFSAAERRGNRLAAATRLDRLRHGSEATWLLARASLMVWPDRRFAPVSSSVLAEVRRVAEPACRRLAARRELDLRAWGYAEGTT